MTPAPMATAAEVAALLGVTTIYVRQQCRARTIPHHRIGYQYRFTVDDVDSILAAAAVPTQPPPDVPPPLAGRRRRYPTYTQRTP